MKKLFFFAAAALAALTVNAQINNPIGTDGRYIVKWDCEAGKFAAANDFEPGETVTIAFDITGTPWATAIQNAPAGSTYGLAAHIWTNDDNSKPEPSAAPMHAAAERLVMLAPNIYGATYNFARSFGEGNYVNTYTAKDYVIYVWGIFHIFGYKVVDGEMKDDGWYMNELFVAPADGADCLFATLPSTGRLDNEFYNDDFDYPYTNHLGEAPNFAAPCVTEAVTAVENVKVEKAQKVIENGQLYLINNGVRYDVTGAVVK